MSTDPPPSVRNVFSGEAQNVVQVGTIHGSVTFGDRSLELPIPRQLPRAPTTFVNRLGDLETMDRLVDQAATTAHPTVLLVTGTAGVGKSAFAVHWAYRVLERFPEGHLFVDLRGYDPRPPMTVEEAVDGFLRALDVPPVKIPTSRDALVGLYRSLLDGRRMLVLLENAHNPEQVRPLLPPSSESLAIVTSRSRMTGLVVRDDALPVALAPLQPEDAVTLFRTVAGEAAPDTEMETTSTLVRQCAYLPLTIRIAAEQAAMRAGTTLSDLSEELAVEHDRLSSFATADDDEATEVRNVLSWSYSRLRPEAARMFRLIALHPGQEISTPAAAALADVTVPEARRLLTSLSGGNLLDEVARDRYRFHDLLRAYGRERAEEEEPESERTRALRRELTWYVHSADAADRVLAPYRRHVPLDPPQPHVVPQVFPRWTDALDWCEVERPTMVAAVDEAVAIGADDVAWKLPVALVTFFHLRRHRVNRLETTRIALEAARRLGDRYGEAWATICVGGALLDLRRFDEGVEMFEQSRVICREIGDRQGEGMSLENLAAAYREAGREADALALGEQALLIWREIGDRRNEAITLATLGDVSFDLRQVPQAQRFYEQALPVARETDRYTEGCALNGLGNVRLESGDPAGAVTFFQQALTLRREISDRLGIGETNFQLAQAWRRMDMGEEALGALWAALAVFEDLDDPRAADVRRELDDLGGGHVPQ